MATHGMPLVDEEHYIAQVAKGQMDRLPRRLLDLPCVTRVNIGPSSDAKYLVEFVVGLGDISGEELEQARRSVEECINPAMGGGCGSEEE